MKAVLLIGMGLMALAWKPISLICLGPIFQRLTGKGDFDWLECIGGVVQFVGGWVTLIFAIRAIALS